MKKTSIIIGLTFQFSFGQSCGVYLIKYVGTIKAGLLKIDEIRLPSFHFLHGLKEDKSEKTYINRN